MRSEVEATVQSVHADFALANIVTADGRCYVLTDETPVRWDRVKVGDRLRCVVTEELPRVLEAKLLIQEAE